MTNIFLFTENKLLLSQLKVKDVLVSQRPETKVFFAVVFSHCHFHNFFSIYFKPFSSLFATEYEIALIASIMKISFALFYPVAYSEPCPTSKMECFAKIVNS